MEGFPEHMLWSPKAKVLLKYILQTPEVNLWKMRPYKQLSFSLDFGISKWEGNWYSELQLLYLLF